MKKESMNLRVHCALFVEYVWYNAENSISDFEFSLYSRIKPIKYWTFIEDFSDIAMHNIKALSWITIRKSSEKKISILKK